MGFDSHFSYMKMMKAATYIMKRDCVFVGTNWDASLPLKDGSSIIIPGLYMEEPVRASDRPKLSVPLYVNLCV